MSYQSMDFELISRVEVFIEKYRRGILVLNHSKAENLSHQRSDRKNILHELAESISIVQFSKTISSLETPSEPSAALYDSWINEAIFSGVVVEKGSMNSGYRIFVSSTMEDLKLERQKIASEITNSENIPIMAERIIEVENTPRKTIESKVDQCDAYIGVFHKKWGFVPKIDNPSRLSITAIEYERAKTRDIPRLVLISNYDDKDTELQDFITKISDMELGVWRHKYEDSNELILEVVRGIPHLVRAINSKHAPSQTAKSSQKAGPPVYTNPVQLRNDADLFICTLYQQTRHVMEEPRNALEIYNSLGIGGVDDKKQGTREVVQELRLRQPPLIEKVVGTEWDVFLNREGLEFCESNCDEPWIRNRIISNS